MLSQVLHAFREMTGGNSPNIYSEPQIALAGIQSDVLKLALPAVQLSSCDHPLHLYCFAPLLALPPVGQFLPPGAVFHPEGLPCKFKFNRCEVMALTS